MNTHQSSFGQKEVAIPGHAHLMLRVYGPIEATNSQLDPTRGFTVLKDGVATARAELEPAERQAAEQLLVSDFPEHAKLL